MPLKTLARPISTKRNLLFQNQGLTLLELMIVVALIVGTISMVVPRFQGPEGQIKAAVRKFSGLSRQIHSSAKLHNKTYRLVLDLGVDKGEAPGQREQKYWVEKTDKAILIPTLEEADAAAKRSDNEKEEDKKKNAGGFDLDKKFNKEPLSLPSGVQIAKVERLNDKESTSEGVTAVYFFPQGISEEVIIHLKSGEKLHWSLAIQPLTGQIYIHDKEVSFKDLK